MFCPSCGNEYNIELKYCNRCGANLGSQIAPAPAAPVIVNVTKPTLIISVIIVLITLGGFGGLLSAVSEMAPVMKSNDPLIAIIFMGTLTIMVIDIILGRLLTKIINASLTSHSQPQFVQQTPQVGIPPQFQNPTTTARLESRPSVTENTTRFFEPYRAPAETPVEIKK